MSALERLLATQEIEELQARRCHAVDHQDWDLFASLHAPDHVSDNDGDEKCVGGKANAVRIAGLLKGKRTLHNLHTPVITFESATRAHGTWSMEDYIWWQQDGVDHQLHGFGFYHETYEKRDGRWLFTRRKLKRHKVLMSP